MANSWYGDAKNPFSRTALLPGQDKPATCVYRCQRLQRQGLSRQSLVLARLDPSGAPCAYQPCILLERLDSAGDENHQAKPVSEITGIDSDYLRQPAKIYRASVARRMSWMANRTTTRIEDIAYCMLGIFDINMALLYGEGSRAFLRLQEEIIKVLDDQTIFCWQEALRNGNQPPDGLFYPRSEDGVAATQPYTITNRGLRITAPILHAGVGAYHILHVGMRTGKRDELSRVLIRLRRLSDDQVEGGKYVRLPSSASLMITKIPPKLLRHQEEVYIDWRNTKSRVVDGLLAERTAFLEVDLTSPNVLLLSYNQRVTLLVEDAEEIGRYLADNALELRRGAEFGRGIFQLRIWHQEAAYEDFLRVFIWAYRFEGRTAWGLQVMPGGSGFDAGRCLENVDGRLEGIWDVSPPLNSALTWRYTGSEQGPLMCFLEFEYLKPATTWSSMEEDAD